MASKFSAGPQALGYYYQARYALYLLLRQSQPAASVAIERLDDIEVSAGSSVTTLAQLKHHITRVAQLTDTSADLWKTLRIWSTQLTERQWDPHQIALDLVTTAIAPEGSAAWYLRDSRDRDTNRADELLLAAAADSKSRAQAMKESFAAFRNLSDPERRQLLNATTILDESENIVDLSSAIRQQIRAAAPPEPNKLDRVYNELEGWWFGIVVEHLAGGSSLPISQLTVYQKLWSITEELKRDNLPISYADAVPDHVVNPETDERIFVRQLRTLNVNTDRIKRAILDYYRAFEQRSSWVSEQLILDEEVTTYEKRLIDEWHALKLALEDELLSPAKLDTECVDLGRRLLKWVETEADIPIRSDVVDKFVMRGSYHMLANEEKPRVHWHPLFLESLTEILAS
jgi:hypothetical protein